MNTNKKPQALVNELSDIIHGIRQGAPHCLGYDAKGESQKAFELGWNSNAERLWSITEKARAALDEMGKEY